MDFCHVIFLKTFKQKVTSRVLISQEEFIPTFLFQLAYLSYVKKNVLNKFVILGGERLYLYSIPKFPF